jgi:FkbM family methyltransferase
MIKTDAHRDRDDYLSEIRSLAAEIESYDRDFSGALTALLLHVPPGRLDAFVKRIHEVKAPGKQRNLSQLLDVLISGNRIALWGAKIEFQTRPALETIIDEILVRREYHFKSASKSPTVIDAGANIGLATYYAKRMCGAGKVIAFEPNPDTFKIISRNAKAAGWPNVELHQAAVSTDNGEASFSLMPGAPLASSLSPRDTKTQSPQVRVPTMDLRAFLKEPIGLLKMDIEGAEADVLEACEGHLEQVENLFVEVHPIAGQCPSLLFRTLGVIERAGFMAHVSRSPWSERAHSFMPIPKASRQYSLSVYATRVL